MDEEKYYKDLPLSIKHLHLMKWTPEQGTDVKKLKIVESIASQWKEAAILLGLNQSQIDIIEDRGSRKSFVNCMDDVLKEWPDMLDKQHKPDYPYTWNGLLELLGDMNYSVVADNLREALSSQKLRQQLESTNSSENKKSRTGCILITAAVIIVVSTLILTSLYTNLWGDVTHAINVRTRSKTLPFLSDNFVGREEEMQELLGRIDFQSTKIRIINIVGTAGFGKSTLAIQLGHRLVDQDVYVHYVDMAEFPSGSVELILAEKILKSSDITAKTITFDRLLRWARERTGDTLLILDNCDNVLHRRKAQLQSAILNIVQASTTVKVIMTSREEALQIEYYSLYKLYQLSPKAGISLLDQKLSSHYKITLKEKEEIAELTGYVPLALHIVGSLLQLPYEPPTPARAIEQLKTNPVSFLSPKDFLAEQRINASISLSYQYLDENLKQAAHILALFPGSFDKGVVLEIASQIREQVPHTETLSLGDSELRTLVGRSLLEYNERMHRYQYHRLIREFLLEKTGHAVGETYFYSGTRQYYLEQLEYHTSNFKMKYVDSLKFLDTERHNIHILLQELTGPETLPRRALLLTLDTVTHAIDIGYLTCRFTAIELINILWNTIHYLDNNVLWFQVDLSDSDAITAISGKVWTHKEYCQQVYIKLVITQSDLIASSDKELASTLMEKRKHTVDLLSQVAELNLKSSQDPSRERNPDSVPLSSKATRQLFYVTLGNLYETQGKHSDVVTCQLKILEDVRKCETEECTYEQIGYMYLNSGNYEEGSRFLELALENNQCKDCIAKASVLVNLYSIYKKTRTWPWASEKETKTISRLVAECDEIERIDDQALFYQWKVVVEVITTVNQAGKNVDFLEERLFSIMSTTKNGFQLQPKYALHLIRLVERSQNNSKIILWGSLLLQPFENYHNFSTEEKLNILRIQLATSTARLNQWHLFEGLDGMEQIYNAIMQDQDLSNHTDTAEINRVVCYNLILRLRYVIPCYQSTLKGVTRQVLTICLYIIPMKIVYMTFVVPFGFVSDVEYRSYERVQRPQKSTAVTVSENPFGIELIEDIASTAKMEMLYTAQSMWNYIVPYSWLLIKAINLFHVFVNVLTVLGRIWILLTIFAIISSMGALFSIIVSEIIIAPLYYKIIMNPSSFHITRKFVVLISNIFILSSQIQVRCIQNIIGIPWLVLMHIVLYLLEMNLIVSLLPQPKPNVYSDMVHNKLSLSLVFLSFVQCIILFFVFIFVISVVIIAIIVIIVVFATIKIINFLLAFFM